MWRAIRRNSTANRWLALVLMLAFLLCHGAMGSVHQVMSAAVPGAHGALHGVAHETASSAGHSPSGGSLVEHALVAHAAAGHGVSGDGVLGSGDSSWNIGYFAVLLLLGGLMTFVARFFRRMTSTRVPVRRSPVRPLDVGLYLPRGPTPPRLQVFLL